MPPDEPSERTTVPALVARWSAAQPDTRFLVTETEHLTFAELDDASARVATLLVRHGVGKGTRVGLLLPNGIEWAVLACGILRAGAVLVPLSTLLRPAELEVQLRIAAVEALVLAPAFRGRDYIADLAAIAPPWVWITPLGAPRLPDVNITTMSSAGRTDASRPSTKARSGGGRSAVAASTSVLSPIVRRRGSSGRCCPYPRSASTRTLGAISVTSAT